MKNFGRRLAVEDDARAVVEPPFGFGDLALGDGFKIDALGEVFTDKSIDILDRAALPGAVGIAEVNGDLGGQGKGGVLGHFPTVVVGEGLAQVGGQMLEGADKGARDAGGVLGAAQGYDHHLAGDLLGNDQDCSAVTGAHDQVCLPVSGKFTALHLGRSFADIDRSGQLAGELALGPRGRSAFGLLAPQVSDQLISETVPCGTFSNMWLAVTDLKSNLL